MNTWVEINLPWSKNEAVEAKVKKLRQRGDKFYAKAMAKAEKELGISLERAREKLDAVRLAELRKRQPDADDDDVLFSDDIDTVKKRYPELDVNLMCCPMDCCDVDWYAKVLKRVKRNPVAVALAEYYHDKYRHDCAVMATPEYMKYEDLQDEALELKRVGSFHNHLGSHAMCRPGVLMEVRNRAGEVRELLIGHLGTHGGPDEFETGPRVIEEDEVVVRCRVIWEPEK